MTRLFDVIANGVYYSILITLGLSALLIVYALISVAYDAHPIAGLFALGVAVAFFVAATERER